MEALKYDAIGNSRVTLKSGYEFLLQEPLFLSALSGVKELKPFSVSFRAKVGDEVKYFHVRRTRRDHFSFLHNARGNGVNFPEPVLNVRDPETRRNYLVMTHEPLESLEAFLASQVPNKRKLAVLKQIGNELVKLNKTGQRHGDVTQSKVFVGKGDSVMLIEPELDEEIVEHIQSDFDQYREMLFHLERELDHEPESLWTAVKNDAFFKTLK